MKEEERGTGRLQKGRNRRSRKKTRRKKEKEIGTGRAGRQVGSHQGGRERQDRRASDACHTFIRERESVHA